MSVHNTTGRTLYVNADWSEVVPGDSPAAAFVLVGENGIVPAEHLDVYLAHVGDERPTDETPTGDPVRFKTAEPETDDESEPEPEPTPEPAAETPKPRRRAKKRAAAKD